ncbi:MAG: DegT/DnrJ/EryC1/StrS family aminotransferase [Candidatus Bathyarchaeia archaeon]
MVEKLAIDGGSPVRSEPWPRRMQFDEEELKAVTEVMKSAIEFSGKLWRMEGNKCEEFEREFASFFGTKYAVAVSSGTAAIHVALASLRLDPGCEVITSPITDVGSVTPIIYQNLVPVFADVDPETLNVTPESIAERITDKTKAIMPVHLWGAPCDMDPVMELAEKHNLVVIEDCAQAHGAVYKGKFVGSIGDMGCFSLMNGKHITTGGEGGAITTSNEEYCQNGMLSSRSRFSPWTTIRFDIVYPVLNYRLTELQASIGLVQLKKLPKIVAKRRELCMKLAKYISHLEAVKFPKILENTDPSFWFLPIFVDLKKITVSIDHFAEALVREGIPVGAKYTGAPLYEYIFMAQRNTYGDSKCPWSCLYYGREIDYSNSCPNAKKALNQLITVTLHESCTEKEVEDISLALEKVEKHYLKR